jgi:protein TonB
MIFGTPKTMIRFFGTVAFAVAVIAASARPAAAQSDLVPASALTSLPQLKSPQQAARIITESYPSQLQSRGIGGSVRVQLIVGSDGKVDAQSVQVVAATIRRLGEAAVDAIRQIEFVPGTVDGKPVRTQIEFPVTYRAN